MAVFKCKMCGGTLQVEENQTTAVCEYCGTRQTLPRLDNDKKAMLYDRANHFRRNNEYDKAEKIYEQILNEDSTDAEAYWSLVLCRYGVEYVEDPATRKRVPTVNRTQFTSVFDDEDYKSALQYADAAQKEVYAQEAQAINEIQKGILAISQKEEPFDVFICYKETDENGRRTPDSVLANDLYHQLTREEFKVFFSRITLEDKLGTAYEPYIFAALNSAKVMVVLGTKPAYFNAVWVKNEWSRYLKLVKQSGGKKVLIPAYKDMDPYDLPEEFAHLQALDMSKLGFVQDLIHGIKKITATDELKSVVKETIVKNEPVDVDALLKRAFMFLEDGNWGNANVYFDKVLDVKPENPLAYLGKLLAENKLPKESQLAELSVDLNQFPNYNKALRYADHDLQERLEKYNIQVKENIEKQTVELVEKAYKKSEESKIKSFKSQQCAESFAFLTFGITVSIMGVIAMYDYLTTKYVLPLIFLGIIPFVISLLSCLLDSSYAPNPQAVKVDPYIFQKVQSIEMAKFHIGKKVKKTNFIIMLCPILTVLINMVIARAASYDSVHWSHWPEVCTWGISLAVGIVVGLVLVIVENKKLKNEQFCSSVIVNNVSEYKGVLKENQNTRKKYKKQFGKSALFAVVTIIIVIAVAIASSFFISQIKYNVAMNAYDSGNYEKAYNDFDVLGRFRDSSKKQDDALCHIELAKLDNVSVGDTIEFDEDEWLVLSVENNNVLILYNDDDNWGSILGDNYTDNYDLADSWKWENSDIRSYMEDDYNHFGSVRKEVIVQTTLYNNEGSYTRDYIFILSRSEAEKYSALIDDAGYYSDWWLRPTSKDDAYYVYEGDGPVYIGEPSPYVDRYAVRPAMWLDLSKMEGK